MRVVTLIPGDGIGPEVTESAARCVQAAGVKIHWDFHIAGMSALKTYGRELPQETLDSIRKNGVALKGPITTQLGEGFRSVNVGLRQNLDLFANVRPCKTYPGVPSKYGNVDLVVIRENTEDLYSGIEFDKGKSDTRQLASFIKKKRHVTIQNDTAISLKNISQHASRRIAEFAFDFARANKRKRVTIVHKANIMKFSDGLFLKTAQGVGKRSRIKFDDRIVDNMTMQLVQKPQEYDVLLCPNLYGDILSDLCAGITGSLGLAPAGNYGTKYALFEPVHGSAPKYAGKNKVNPGAAILAACMMLRHIDETKAANKIEKALLSVLREGKKVTYDLSKHPVGTREMTEAIINRI